MCYFITRGLAYMQHKNVWQLKELRSAYSAVVLIMVLLLVACGGGGGGGDVTEPAIGSSPPEIASPPPLATASTADIVVTAGTPPEISNDQQCSLIEAIINANNDDSTHADCRTGSGADVIILPASSTQLLTTAHNSIYGPTGLPVITSTITIEGNGSSIGRESSAPSFRILAVAKGAELYLHQTTISGGASASDGVPMQGGGVLNYGVLEVNKSKIINNTSAHHGGGIHSEGGTLVVRNSILSGNFALAAGGAIAQIRNSGILLNNECYENIAQQDGGCMWAGGTSTVTVTNNTIRANFGKAGAGLRAEWDTVLLVNYSTVSENLALGSGGGVSGGAHSTVIVLNTTITDNVSEISGGGVTAGGSLTFVKYSTVSGNFAPKGGGIAAVSSGTADGTAMVKSSTIVFNQASEKGGGVLSVASRSLVLSHALIAGNTAMSQPSEVDEGTGTVIADDFNMFGYNGNAATVGFQPGTKDIVPSSSLGSILDAELRNNGGATDTHALIAGSPAIDSGDQNYSNMTWGGQFMYDQRGPDFSRFDTERGKVDIGAFEVQ